MIDFILRIAISYLVFIYFLLPKTQGNRPFEIGLKCFAWVGFLSAFVPILESGIEYFARSALSALVFGGIAFCFGFIYGVIRSKREIDYLNQDIPHDDINQTESYPIHASGPVSMTTDYPSNATANAKQSMPFKAIIDEDKIYADIAEELETGATDKGLWTRLFAEYDGDERKTKAHYIKKRAERLISAEKLHLEQEHAALEQSPETAQLDDVPQTQPLIQEEVQPVKQLTPKEASDREAIRQKVAESIRLDQVRNSDKTSSKELQQEFKPETKVLIRKYVSLIASGDTRYETYSRLLYMLGGNIGTEGVFNLHYIVTYKYKRTRIYNYDDLRTWFTDNVFPDCNNLQNTDSDN